MIDSASAPTADDRYIVVARRYRPLGFEQLVGQEHVTRGLINAIQTGRVGHAYLFTGARGTGKTSTARIFAKALNAPEGPTPHPDNASDICQAIDAGEDIDVLEIDGASNRGIDEVRQLRAGVGIRPSRARYKIYIIDEVHMLTGAAFNALLKTLEEPPEHVKFIFCTTDPEKLPITVLSRCQRFDFAPVQSEEITTRLREIVQSEGAEAEEDALRLLARRAAGSMRDSQSLLEQLLGFSSGRITVEAVHSMLGTADDARLSELAETLARRDAAAALQHVEAAVAAGVDAGQLAEQLLGHYRDVMVATVGCDAELLRASNASMLEELRQRGEQLGLQTILGIVGLLDQTLARMRQSIHSQTLLEMALVQVCSLPDLQKVADLVAGLGDSRGGPPGQGPAARPETAGNEKKNGSPPLAELRRPETSRIEPPARPAEASSPPAAAEPSGGARSGGPSGAEPAPPPSSARTEAALGPEVGPGSVWSQEGARRCWETALDQIDGLTADLARQGTIEVAGAGKLRVVFPAHCGVAKASCEKPERKSTIERALADAVAQDMHSGGARGGESAPSGGGGVAVLVEFALQPPSAAAPHPVAPVPAGVSRMQRMRQIEQDPMIRQVVEVFQAEIVRVDEPRGSR